jgi:hypothetical protein
MVNVSYLVHVGCHLDRHVVASLGANVWPGVDAVGAYGMLDADPPGNNWKAGAVGKGGNGYAGADRDSGDGYVGANAYG